MKKSGNTGNKTGLFIRWDKLLLKWHKGCTDNDDDLHTLQVSGVGCSHHCAGEQSNVMLSATAAHFVKHTALIPTLSHGSNFNLYLLHHKRSLKILLLLASHPI